MLFKNIESYSQFYHSNSPLSNINELTSAIINNYNHSNILSVQPILNNSKLFNFMDLNIFENLHFFTNFFFEITSSSALYKDLTSDIDKLTYATDRLSSGLDLLPEHEKLFEIYGFNTKDIDMGTVELLSTPDCRLFYPEPFIASPSFAHDDIWYIHILHFQHWLWFMFISLIMFYFITFVNVVRWCNIRIRPKRETRGVSRAKCADLITAFVPVSWASAIIIQETVDAMDYYDGFGTGEILIGIRAYQWGWEYYYPRNIDLNYNTNTTSSTLVGNSLKYSASSSNSLKNNEFWKNFKNKNSKSGTNTPAHLLLTPNDNTNLLTLLNFSDIGLNTSSDSEAFKKIQSFSKAPNHLLYSHTSEYNNNYKSILSNYLNDLDLLNSLSYGTVRQHNLNSTASTLNFLETFLDNSNVNKYLNYNLNTTTTFKSSLSDNLNLNNFSKSNPLNFSNKGVFILDLFFKNIYFNNSNFFLNQMFSYPNKLSTLSLDTDFKNYKNPLKYALLQKSKKENLFLHNWIVDTNFSLNDINLINLNASTKFNFFNNPSLYKFKDLKSPNAQFLPNERDVRNLNNINSYKTNLNFNSSDTNLTSLIADNFTKNLNTSSNTVYELSTLDWINKANISKILSSSTSSITTHSPIISSNDMSIKNYDRLGTSSPSEMFKSKEDSAPNFLFTTYWLNYWSNTNNAHRYSNLLGIDKLSSNFYLPHIVDYAEYDFRNWQAIELLEDSFWEASYPSYLQNEYSLVRENVKESEFIKKYEDLFNTSMRQLKYKKLKLGTLAKPFLKDTVNATNLTSLPIFNDSSLTNTSLLNTKDYNFFINELNLDSFDNSYENTKYLNYLYNLNYKNLLNTSYNYVQPFSYTSVVDSFRPDYEDTTLSSLTHTDETWFTSENSESLFNDFRLSNPLKLRSTTKNSIVTYNAIQKVFKSRFDEGRSNARLGDFSNSYVAYPFLVEQRVNYESLLGKNKESFFNVNNYSTSFKLDSNLITSILNTLNIYFIDIPFLLSMKSDPTRYLWFDWYTRWSTVELLYSSLSRFSLLGMPYANKNFEYNTALSDEINDSENYLTKLRRARKNYLSNWAYSPYLYLRLSNWYKLDVITSEFFNKNSLYSSRLVLKITSLYWSNRDIFFNVKSSYTPTISGISTPSRNSWRPISGVQSYIYNLEILSDILSKREFLYRQYFFNKDTMINLPKYLSASPNNPLFEEIKGSYPFIDPITYSSEFSRELYYQNINFLKYTILKDFLSLFNTSILNNYFFVYLFGLDTNTKFNQNLELYKNQFRPLKKGVSNMLRLHATGAIALPIEIRLHILASSRDVIHSWAVPSAGIKIDCVPGYSSHRIMIFLLSGIYWGQCMEICGRYHHWMPIIVYFMKRDLFFLWCTHFMHYSTIDHVFNMNDKQLSDLVKVVSFDKTTWVKDLNNLL